jgi:hypothetical protein
MCIMGLDLAPFYDFYCILELCQRCYFILHFSGVFTSSVNLQLNLSDNIVKLPVIWNTVKPVLCEY